MSLPRSANRGFRLLEIVSGFVTRHADASSFKDCTPAPVEAPLRQALVLRHLESLSPGARGLLECAAVLGRELDEQCLARMCPLAESERQESVSELLARQIVEASGLDSLRFAHDQFREVAYAQIGPERRKTLHRAAAEGLEALAGAAGLRMAELARHWHAAGAHDRARPCFLAAARQAVERSAHAEAERLYAAHLDLLRAPSAEGLRVRVELSRSVLTELGKHAEAREQCRQAL